MAIALEREKKMNVMGIMITCSLIVHLFVFTHISEIYKLKPAFEKKEKPIKIEVTLQEIPKPAPIKMPPPAAPASEPITIPVPIPEPIKEEIKKKIPNTPPVIPIKKIERVEPIKKKVIIKKKKPIKIKERPEPVNKAVEKPLIEQKVVVPIQTDKPVMSSPSVKIAVSGVKNSTSARLNPQPSTSQSDEISAKAYFNAMRLMIEKNKRYPQMARRRNQEGSVRVRFLIDNNGNVNALEIVKKAEYESLNKAALEAVRRAAPFAKPPASVAKSALKLELTINFKLI